MEFEYHQIRQRDLLFNYRRSKSWPAVESTRTEYRTQNSSLDFTCVWYGVLACSRANCTSSNGDCALSLASYCYCVCTPRLNILCAASDRHTGPDISSARSRKSRGRRRAHSRFSIRRDKLRLAGLSRTLPASISCSDHNGAWRGYRDSARLGDRDSSH